MYSIKNMSDRQISFILLIFSNFLCNFSHAEENQTKTLKERIKLDYQMEDFLTKEFDYAQPYEIMNEHTLLPFRDIHEDHFWKVGWINFKELRSYIEKNITKLFHKTELHPWLPIEDLKNELAKCGVQYKYVSMSQQQFVYDKDIGSFMNLMKFSCVLTDDENIIFGVGLQRFKFRLKEVFLNKQKLSNKHTYWASATRPITIKDMQKLMEHFTSKFADGVHTNFEKELHKLNIKDEESGSDENIEEIDDGNGPSTTGMLSTSTDFTTTVEQEEYQNLLRHAFFGEKKNGKKEKLFDIPKEARQALLNLFPAGDIVVVPHFPKEHTFKYVSIPITIRIIIAHHVKVPEILDIFQHELSDDSKHSLEMCLERSCEEPDEIIELGPTGNSDHKRFFGDRSLHYKISANETLLAYASANPHFYLDIHKKKRGQKTREVKQEFDDEARRLWYDLLESRVAQNFYIHHKPTLKYTNSE